MELSKATEVKEEKPKCINDECDNYPYYGCAPHECYFKKPGGFDNPLGTSTVYGFEKWPGNFYAEIEDVNNIKQELSGRLCGVYYCPECSDGAAIDGLYNAKQVSEILSNPSAI